MEPKPNKLQTLARVAVLVLIVALLALWLVGRSASSRQPTGPKPVAGAQDRTDACVMAQVFMQQRLAAPETARFQLCSQANIAFVGDGVFDVVSYVDSQNSFGAQIRTIYSMRLKSRGDDRWDLLEVETTP